MSETLPVNGRPVLGRTSPSPGPDNRLFQLAESRLQLQNLCNLGFRRRCRQMSFSSCSLMAFVFM